MPKTKLAKFKETNKKLSPAERSQVAKDRWARRREAEDAAHAANAGSDLGVNEPTPAIAGIATNVYYAPPETGFPVQGFVENAPIPAPQPPEQPPVAPESIAPGMSGTPENITPFRPAPSVNSVPYIAPDPAPQPAPASPKKAKRYTGPKEFSIALKAAEGRLAKAIVERAEAAGKMAMLQAEIPSLVQIINALKGQQHIPAASYDLSVQNTAFPYPSVPQLQPYVDPLAAIAGAAAAPPMSRAMGNAVQFSPEVLGSLEGPDDDDDPDKYITGLLAGGGWK